MRNRLPSTFLAFRVASAFQLLIQKLAVKGSGGESAKSVSSHISTPLPLPLPNSHQVAAPQPSADVRILAPEPSPHGAWATSYSVVPCTVYPERRFPRGCLSLFWPSPSAYPYLAEGARQKLTVCPARIAPPPRFHRPECAWWLHDRPWFGAALVLSMSMSVTRDDPDQPHPTCGLAIFIPIP